MRKIFTLLTIASLIFGVVGVANATQFTIQNLSIDYYPQGADPLDKNGLELNVSYLIAGSYSFTLTNTPDMHVADLARITSPEGGINANDRSKSQPFVVSFEFVDPEFDSITFSATSKGNGNNRILIVSPGKEEYDFGFGGLLQIEILSYNENWKDPKNPLQARFKLIHESDPPPAVPEPATMFLLGSGLIGIGAFVRRKSRK